MANIIRYEYEQDIKTLVSESDLQEFMENNTVVNYEEYDGSAVLNDFDDLDEDTMEEIDTLEEEE